VLLRLGPGEAPPAGLRLQLHVAGGEGDGRLRGDRFSGAALSVLPGEAVERRVDVPARSVLRFATALEAAVTDAKELRGPVSFQVRVDDRLVFEHREPSAASSAFAWHAVPLGEESRPGARIRFEVAGELAHTAFFAPVVGPRDVGRPGARPWRTARPDLVIFLADTLRADVLGAYGSTLGLTPHLDRIAAGSLLFRRAWSPATFTQAAHAALFSGYFARQVAAYAPGARLPAPVVTLAERLAAAGYRTGAVTDAVVVSERFGFAQGFEWFDEHYASLASTLARATAFLDADDGRPVFLFVHTYRVHNPYRVSDETRREAGDRFDFAEDSAPLEAREMQMARRPGFDRARDVHYAALVARLHDLYRGAVIDLDRGFGGFHDALRQRGWLGSGVLVFTSDHGEAFSEHDQLGHGGRVWEEQTRIPLFLSGPGIEPGVVEQPASLLDLAPTLAELAGVAGEPDWPGVSLLRRRGERAELAARPIFLFENRDKPGSTLAIVEGGRKVIAYEDPASLARGERFGAFDLAADPGERDGAAAADAAWVQELLERLGPAAAELLRPREQGESAELGAEQIERLRALGYVEE
jgi:arylsulfatase